MDRIDCPKCGSVAPNIVPVKDPSKAPIEPIYGCQTCGTAFDKNKKAIINDGAKLRDIFRGATQGNQTITQIFGGEQISPAKQAMMSARILEYGLQMWYDGLKQGLLLGLTGETQREAAKQKESSQVPS